MKECTETDRPLISILMAIYNPRMDWLREQLVSLGNQTWRPLELLLLDDCSTKTGPDELRACVATCAPGIPCQVLRNPENLGSARTFEKLTLLAGGEYIAYCDQDDVWAADRIEACFKALEHSEAALVFSDMNVIDAAGARTADSITKVRRHHRFQSGKNLGASLLFRNFVTGCTMMIRTQTARDAVPFCPYMVHDHWLALYCAVSGEILFLERPLVNYRIHGNNQTLMLAGVADKASYARIRIEEALRKFLWLREHLNGDAALNRILDQAALWAAARREHFRGKGHWRLIWKYREFDCMTSLFELAAPLMPEKLFLFFIALARKNLV
jgi:glycosyltransferase involved in cell wall biosynthesis